MSGRASTVGTNAVEPTEKDCGTLGLPSTMIEKPKPRVRAYTGMPSGVVVVGSINVSSERVRPKKVTTGPGALVGVRVPVRVGVPLGVGVVVRVGVCDAGVGVPGVGVRVTVGVRVGEPGALVGDGVDVARRDGVRLGVGVAVGGRAVSV